MSPTKTRLNRALNNLKSTFGELKTKKFNFNDKIPLTTQHEIALVVDGLALSFALNSEQARRLLVILLNLANSVVFYNMYPF